MSNEQETVSVSIPAPPKGWKIDGVRKAAANEMIYNLGRWESWGFSKSIYDSPCAVRVKTAREWLAELPDGWREEALAHCGCLDDGCDTLSSALLLLRPWSESPSGQEAWREVFATADTDTPIPPHPSTVKSEAEKRGFLAPIEDEKTKPEYEEIPVVLESSFLIANGRSVSAWPSYIYFAGAIYEHPNGHRKVFGFTHPIFVRAASQAAIWDWSHAETKCHTHMIRPVAIRRKVAK